MRFLSALSLVFLMGCGAATTRVAATPEAPPWTEFTAGRLTVSVPPGWINTTPAPRDGEGQQYSTLEFTNADGQEITIFHPHGNIELAQQAYFGTHMQLALIAAAAQQQPDSLAEAGLRSLTVTEPAECSTIPGYIYVAHVVMLDETAEDLRVVLMFNDLYDEFTVFIVSTTVPAAAGEELPAMVLEIVRTMRYTAPVEPSEPDVTPQ